ncbi:MAG: hypothetical protein IPM42_09570 [Saprospiraceae bacterium]|nr:hypothetical protein [Saprospiraceae bacterium]
MNLKLLDRKDIDISRWDSLICKDSSENVYSLSWYLDAVTDNGWKALIADDYSFVMPVYIRKKWLLPYATQPFLCQQNGIFGHQKVTDETVLSFLKSLPKFLIKLNFNIHNRITEGMKGFDIIERSNQIIRLENEYENIRSGYNRSTIRNLQKGENQNVVISTTTSLDEFTDFMAENDETGLIKQNFQITKNLISAASQNAEVILQVAEDTEGIIAAGYYILYGERIFFLMSAANKMAKEKRVMFQMIDQVVRQYAGTAKIFDFVGSSIPNVAQRNLGFGAETTCYYGLRKNLI